MLILDINKIRKMKNTDSKSHLRGESIYLDDIPELQGTLYGLVFDSPVAHAKNLKPDYSKAQNLTGVVKIFDCAINRIAPLRIM